MADSARRPSTATRAPLVAHSSPVDVVLVKLERVRKCGRGWVARCPAHEDKTASLSIAVGENGSVLVHCFAMCSALDVVHAVGLELADLYPPKRDLREMTPAERAAMREGARQAQWMAALSAITKEIVIVRLAAQQTSAGHALSREDLDRVQLACDRIEAAEQTLRAR